MATPTTFFMQDQRPTLLLTGATGFIGPHVARHFDRLGWQVVGIGTAPAHERETAAWGAPLSAYEPMHLPDAGFGRMLAAYAPDLCIHCAGSSSVGRSVAEPAHDYYTNAVLTFELLNALREHAPACGFLNLSSAAVYGNPARLPISEADAPAPVSPYGYHKRMGEVACEEFAALYGLRTASVRIFSAYGPGLRRQVIWDVCRKALTEPELHLFGTGEESRDFVHPSDIAAALEAVWQRAPMQGEAYNLGSGEEVTIAQLAQRVLDVLGSPRRPRFDGKVPEGTPRNWRADITALRQLGFSPAVSFEDGIAEFVAWCREELTKEEASTLLSA